VRLQPGQFDCALGGGVVLARAGHALADRGLLIGVRHRSTFSCGRPRPPATMGTHDDEQPALPLGALVLVADLGVARIARRAAGGAARDQATPPPGPDPDELTGVTTKCEGQSIPIRSLRQNSFAVLSLVGSPFAPLRCLPELRYLRTAHSPLVQSSLLAPSEP